MPSLIKSRYWLVLGLIAMMMSCRGPEVNDEPIAETLPSVDTSYFSVQVDRLRMRTAPSLESNTVTLLAEGALVKYWGDRSQGKTQITLRGKSISDHWMHVRYGSFTGWVFGGALAPQMDQSLADALIVPGSRVGPILSGDTEQTIIDRLGPDRVQRGEYMVGEGEMLEVTYVFPGTEKELILLWTAEDFTHLREVRISKAGAPWKTEAGLTVGSTLKEVQEMNGKPFLMSGFQWDYAGSTMSWNLGNLPPDLVLTFAEPKRVHKSLLGDLELRSDSDRLRRANPKVQVLRIIFS